MATAKVIADYGGPKVDATSGRNPTSQVWASHFNRLSEDAAHLTRTGYKTVVKFTTVAAGNPPANTVYHRSQWGSSDSYKPTIVRNGAGDYTLTWATTYTDALSTVEAVSFFAGDVSCSGSNAGDLLTGRTLSVVSNVVRVQVYANDIAADVGNVSAAAFEVVVWLT